MTQVDSDGAPATLDQVRSVTARYVHCELPPRARYLAAQGARRAVLRPGDVLYIPRYWHHAVSTVPDKTCVAASLNFWYTRAGEQDLSAATPLQSRDSRIGSLLADRHV